MKNKFNEYKGDMLVKHALILIQQMQISVHLLSCKKT